MRPTDSLIDLCQGVAGLTTYRVVVDAPGASVNVATDAPDILEFLENLFSPFGYVRNESTGRDPDVWCHVVTTPVGVGEVLRRIPKWRSVKTYARRTALYSSVGECDVYIHSEAGFSSATIYWKGNAYDFSLRGKADHLHVERLVKEPLKPRGRAAGVTRLHAAAVEVDGIGVGLPGDSGAGKSTLFMDLLLEGARYLAGDAVRISVSHGRVRLMGWPAVTRLGEATLVQHSGLDSMLPRSAPASHDGKFEYYPEVLAKAFGDDILGSSAWCGVLVFPDLDLRATRCSLEPLSSIAGRQRLVSIIEGTPDADWLPERQFPKAREREREIVSSLLDCHLPYFSYHFGTPSTRPGRGLLDALRREGVLASTVGP